MMAPIERNGPNGTAIFMLLFVQNIINKPVNVPTADAIKTVKKTPFQPIVAPIIAKSLISPPPIPSFLVNR